MNEFKKHIRQINELCKLHKVRSLFAFGSVTTNKFNINSDIDLVVDIDSNDPLDYSDNYFAIKFQLEDILHRQVDLLEERAIKNPLLKKEIDNTKVLVYGR
ncbi:MAG: nucleotidyltransferase domain-containing protein [Bacteroidota bacterium]